jgi:hypothetical protein
MALPSRVNNKSQEQTVDQEGGRNDAKAQRIRRDTGGEPLSQEAVIAGLDDDNAFLSPTSNKSRIKKAYKLFRMHPEIVGILKALVDDVMGDGTPRFEYAGPRSTPGTQRINDAKEFWEDEFHMVLEEALYDYYITGDAYIYERLVRDDDIKAVVDKHMTNYDFSDSEIKSLAKARLFNDLKQAVDEDALTLQGAQVVPSTTMFEDIDQNGNVEEFVQRVGSKKRRFTPDEIVHMENMPLNGQVYSFTPMESMLEEINMLGHIKDYHTKRFQNAGMANRLYMLPSESPNSQNYENFIKQIRKFRKTEHTNKDLVVTGEVESESLNDIDDTMDFRELDESVVVKLMQGWNMPPSRLGIDSSGGQNESQSSTMSVEGYYKRIGREQSKIETYLNNEVFEPYFNVKINLPPANVKQQIREADRDQKRLNTALRMAAAGLMDREAVREYMGIDKTKAPQLDDMSFDEFRKLATELAEIAPQETLSNAEVNENEASERSNEQRQQTQEENERDGTTDSMADNSS